MLALRYLDFGGVEWDAVVVDHRVMVSIGLINGRRQGESRNEKNLEKKIVKFPYKGFRTNNLRGISL